jgi:predicted house-cleaning NTP pyrophosphatase (Maf/HAM1 superfamily)
VLNQSPVNFRGRWRQIPICPWSEYAVVITVILSHGRVLEKPCDVEEARSFMAQHSGSFVQTLNGLLLTEVGSR